MKNQKNCFIGCYFDFINKQDYSDIDWKTLRTQCFYFDNDDVDSVSCMDDPFLVLAIFVSFVKELFCRSKVVIYIYFCHLVSDHEKKVSCLLLFC